jgi:Uri superfamily endonuclease
LSACVGISVGKLGRACFPTGFYIYVGSAFGNGGLAARIQHHLVPVQRHHWHLDYFRSYGEPYSLWYTVGPKRYEHEWAAILQHMPSSSVIIKNFGATDCKCLTHMFHFDEPPALSEFIHAATQLSLATPLIHDIACVSSTLD